MNVILLAIAIAIVVLYLFAALVYYLVMALPIIIAAGILYCIYF